MDDAWKSLDSAQIRVHRSIREMCYAHLQLSKSTAAECGCKNAISCSTCLTVIPGHTCRREVVQS